MFSLNLYSRPIFSHAYCKLIHQLRTGPKFSNLVSAVLRLNWLVILEIISSLEPSSETTATRCLKLPPMDF